MKLIGPDKYILEIAERCAAVTGPAGKPHFVSPATSKKKPKLYVVSSAGALIYIGVTSQSMSTRLRMGLTADGSHGYYGYTWGRKNHTVHVDIWYLTESDDPTHDLETIEAETVFLFRQQSGQWPSEQMEIHFHASNDDHKYCAKQIVEHLNIRG